MSTNNAMLFVAPLVAAHRLASHAHDRYGNNMTCFFLHCAKRVDIKGMKRQGCSLRDPRDVRPLPGDRLQPSRTAAQSTGSHYGDAIVVRAGGAVAGAVIGGVLPVKPALVILGLGHRRQRDS